MKTQTTTELRRTWTALLENQKREQQKILNAKLSLLNDPKFLNTKRQAEDRDFALAEKHLLLKKDVTMMRHLMSIKRFRR